jgi:N-formylglutamate deformylase
MLVRSGMIMVVPAVPQTGLHDWDGEIMTLLIDDVLLRHDPVDQAVPVVFDSPHSGSRYPDDFEFTCPLTMLRQTEDAYVDQLFGSATDYGATLLLALFPRSYVDVNRAPDDLDPDQLVGVWPGLLNPSEKCRHGMGLIRTHCRPGVPLYQGRLPVSAVLERIERYWRPYHEQLACRLDRLHATYGAVWHVNCHSMPSLGPLDGQGRGQADFVIGDRDGCTSEPGFTRLVAETLRGLGYRVRINDPYKGVELIRRYSQPTRGRHSIQLEVDRRLYMHEETLEKHAGFDSLGLDLSLLIRRICEYARRECGLRSFRQAAE